MKKIYLIIVIVMSSMAVALQSCNNGKTYAEMKEEEADAIDEFISKNNFQVIDENTFLNAQDTTTSENQFVLFKESGIYMNIVYRGDGEILKDGSYELMARHVEVMLQDRTGDLGVGVGDTLTCSMFPNMSYPEELKVTKSGETISGSFLTYVKGVSMWYKYNSAAIPNGWLAPLPYLKPGRTTVDAKLARVKLILPHSEGTSTASQNVYPCYYEISYQLGR